MFKDMASSQQDPNTSTLEEEIALLRAMIRRTVQLAEGVVDLREATRVLDALGAATNRLAVLLRTQKSLQERKTAMADEISEAIQQVNSELRSKK